MTISGRQSLSDSDVTVPVTFNSLIPAEIPIWPSGPANLKRLTVTGRASARAAGRPGTRRPARQPGPLAACRQGAVAVVAPPCHHALVVRRALAALPAAGPGAYY